MPINPGRRRQTVNFLSVTHEARRKSQRRMEGKRDATLPPTVTLRTAGSPLIPGINIGQDSQENISEGPREPQVLTGSGIPKAASGLPSRALCRAAARAGLRWDIPWLLPGCSSASQTITVSAYSKHYQIGALLRYLCNNIVHKILKNHSEVYLYLMGQVEIKSP